MYDSSDCSKKFAEIPQLLMIIDKCINKNISQHDNHSNSFILNFSIMILKRLGIKF